MGALREERVRVRRRVRARRRGDRLCQGVSPGNHRVDFARFLLAVGWVAAQKGLDAPTAVQWFKRAKVSMVSVAKPAEFSAKAKPGSHSGVVLAAAREQPLDSPTSPSSPAASSSGENSPKNANAAPARAKSAVSSSHTATRKAPRPDSLRPAVADPAAAERVIAAALNPKNGQPPRAATLPMILADIGALEGLCPNRAGAAVHGARCRWGFTATTRAWDATTWRARR